MAKGEEEKTEQSHILPGGSRLDTTLAVPVPSPEVDMIWISNSLVETLKSRWTPTKPGVEAMLDRVVGWADADLRIHLLGGLAMRTDDQIQEEAVELVGALENVAYTNTITKMGEGVMTDVVELCTTLTNKRPDNLTTYNMEGDETRGQDHQSGGQQHPQQPHHLPLQPQQLGDMKDTGIGQHHQHQPEERILNSEAKANYWKKYRSGGERKKKMR